MPNAGTSPEENKNPSTSLHLGVLLAVAVAPRGDGDDDPRCAPLGSTKPDRAATDVRGGSPRRRRLLVRDSKPAGHPILPGQAPALAERRLDPRESAPSRRTCRRARSLDAQEGEEGPRLLDRGHDLAQSVDGACGGGGLEARRQRDGDALRERGLLVGRSRSARRLRLRYSTEYAAPRDATMASAIDATIRQGVTVRARREGPPPRRARPDDPRRVRRRRGAPSSDRAPPPDPAHIPPPVTRGDRESLPSPQSRRRPLSANHYEMAAAVPARSKCQQRG